MNKNLEFKISELTQTSKDDPTWFKGYIEIYDKDTSKNIGELSYKKFTYKIYIDHVSVEEPYKGSGLCPKMFAILIDKFPDIQIFMLANYGGISACKCYIKSFINKNFDVFIGGGLFNYKYMRNNNMTIKQKFFIHINHTRNNLRKKNNTQKNTINSLCSKYGDFADMDFLFLRK